MTVLRRAYSRAPLRVRLHAWGRFLSCPFLPVVERLAPGARVLDLGAGHGTFARLAVEQGAASVVALDPDWRKLVVTYRHPRVRFVAGYLDALEGPFDAVALLDVLYRFPRGEWDALLAALARLLAPGGVLLIKDLDPEKGWKHTWNRAQERVSDRLGLTLGDAFSYEPRATVAALLRGHGFTDVRAVDLDSGYPHAHVLYEARRAEAGGDEPPVNDR
jgi:SAM-dependent methyltransferase